MPSADEILTSLESKYAQQAELRKKLDGSMAIQRFMPDAFKHGTVKVGGRSVAGRPHEGTITFTLGNGDVREMPAMKVPVHLWPAPMRDEFDRMPKYQKQAIFRRMP